MKEHNPLRSLAKKDLRMQVFDQLVNQIKDGVWKPGDKIPSENELSEILGVSRISVREAIQKLVAMDLVETFRGKGTYVKEFSTNSYLNSLAPMLILNLKDILNVLEYRRIIEVGIVDLYVERANEYDIQVLKQLLNKMIQNKEKLSKYSTYDLNFHLKLYEMTKNPLIIKISNMISDILNSAMEEAITLEGAQEGIDFHTQIIEAIEARDAERLKAITKSLLYEVEAEVKEKIK